MICVSLRESKLNDARPMPLKVINSNSTLSHLRLCLQVKDIVLKFDFWTEQTPYKLCDTIEE